MTSYWDDTCKAVSYQMVICVMIRCRDHSLLSLNSCTEKTTSTKALCIGGPRSTHHVDIVSNMMAIGSETWLLSYYFVTEAIL